MLALQSYALGAWRTGGGDERILRHAATAQPVATIGRADLDFGAMLDYARHTGGPALRALTFHQRALLLKAMARHLMDRKETYYALSGATGATRTDAWIDIEGGIGTLFAYSGKARRELPNDTVFVDGACEPLSKDGSFIGQHVCLPLRGVAVHINAFNFPCWGMLEKLAPTLLAGLPAIVKPASQTAWLTERMFRDLVDADILPAGSIQLICGGVGDLLDHLDEQDVVTFTGSASTGRRLKQHPRIVERSIRFNMEADSLNAALLGPDAAPESAEFELFVREVAREMTVKCGQKCTAIRRAIVPAAWIDAVAEALRERLMKIRIGDPDDDATRMGPLVGLDARAEVLAQVARLRSGAELVLGDDSPYQPEGFTQGAFVRPMVLLATDTAPGAPVHEVEAFGPVASLLGYDDLDEAVELARRGAGSLVGSVFTGDDDIARELALGCASHHGRLLIVNRDAAPASTGHGSPLPGLVHGGPGRAGGGEELGGIRAVMHYLQRTALQGSPNTLSQVCNVWLPGARRREDDVHPFRKSFDELALGDCLVTGTRAVTIEDIERFAELTGDTFYAHMDEAAAAANPFFEGRVAHGYYVVSVAAGLFVDPAPGPVLANYGLENLRFLQPVYPGDVLRATLTCKQKIAREGGDHGEVRWDTTVVNQDGAVVAQYDVLTLVARSS